MMTTTVIFDLDGTLVDSERLSARAFQILLPGLPLSIEEFLTRHAGWKLAEVVEALTDLMGVPADPDFIPRFRALTADLFRQELRTFDGVAEALSRLPMTLALASNAPREKVQLALDATELAGFFGDRVFSAYDINRWKPEPDLFLHAAARLGAAPAECLVIEDSATGIAAARAAQMAVLHFHNDPTRPTDATSFGRYRDLPDLVAATLAKSATLA